MGQVRITTQEFRRLARPSKFHAVKTVVDGIKFDSRAEAEMYSLLKVDSEICHIDVHPRVSLPGGVRLSIDFLVWKADGSVEAVEVKGFETQDFKTKRKLFDQFHPLAPLKVFRKVGAEWCIL